MLKSVEGSTSTNGAGVGQIKRANLRNWAANSGRRLPLRLSNQDYLNTFRLNLVVLDRKQHLSLSPHHHVARYA